MKDILSKQELRQQLDCSAGYAGEIINGIKSHTERYGDLPVYQCGRRIYVRSAVLHDYLHWNSWLDNPLLSARVPPYTGGGARSLSSEDKEDIAEMVVVKLMTIGDKNAALLEQERQKGK